MSASSEKEKSAFDIIKSWFLNSPTHGIRRISRAGSTTGRLFWSITFLGFTTLMCIFIYTIIMKFIAHPTKINLSVRQHRDPNHFPAITFCNINPLRTEKFLEEDIRPPCKDAEECQNRVSEYMAKLLAENVNNNHSTVVKLGYTLDDLLMQCTFNRRPCYRNFTRFFHPNYGNCYTFNNDDHVENSGRNNTSNIWSVDDENVEDGYSLFMELFLYQNEYIPYLDDRAAFRIFIHRKCEIPVLSQNSLFLAPTTFTKLIFSQRIITLSQQCRNELTGDMKQVFNLNNVRYSQDLCFKLCEFRFIEKECQCIDPLFMIFLQFFTGNRTTLMHANKLCSIKDKCRANRTHINLKKFCPKCLPECELVQYTVQSSYADYPNSKSKDKVLTRVEEHLKTTGYTSPNLSTAACSNNRRGSLVNDIVAVEISASPYATEILAESPMYTWVDLVSSIGGQTGLWIGVSLISFVEIAELVFLLICHFIKIIYRRILINVF